jgi:hypothetical protein
MWDVFVNKGNKHADEITYLPVPLSPREKQ